MHKLPLLDSVLQRAEVANVALRITATYNDIAFFAQQFPPLLKDQSQEDTKQEEFAQYQVDNKPSSVLMCISCDKQQRAISQIMDAMMFYPG